MKKRTISKLLLTFAAMGMAAACQPKKPVPPPQPPVAPPQAYESENCTDVDECSEGAAVEPAKSEAPAAVESASAPVEAPAAQPVAVEPAAAPAEAKESVQAEPTAPAVESVKADSAAEPAAPAAEKTASSEAPLKI